MSDRDQPPSIRREKLSASATGARQPGTLIFLALVSITLVGPLSIHLFLPALPHVREAFAIDESGAQLAFSLSMLSMAVATLFYGSLSDRFGRLPVLLGGLGLFAVGAAVAAFAPSITILIFGRIIQGLGAACGVVLARAIIRDLYGADRLGQMIAYLTAAYVLGPMFAPPLGGALTDAFGWQSILVVPAAFGVIAIIIAVTIIGETRRAEIEAQPALLRSYWRLLSAPRFLLFALNPAIGSAGFFALNAGASYLMVEVIGRPATEFGLYFMLGPVGFMLGNFLSGRLSGRLSGNFLVVFGSVVSVFGAVLLIVLILAFGLAPLCLFLPSCLISIGQGLSMPHAQASAIATEPALTGTASGIVVFLQFLFAAGLTQLVAFGSDGTAAALIVVVITACVLALICGGVAVLLSQNQHT